MDYRYYDSVHDAISTLDLAQMVAEPEGRRILDHAKDHLWHEVFADYEKATMPLNRFLMSGSGVNADTVSRF